MSMPRTASKSPNRLTSALPDTNGWETPPSVMAPTLRRATDSLRTILATGQTGREGRTWHGGRTRGHGFRNEARRPNQAYRHRRTRQPNQGAASATRRGGPRAAPGRDSAGHDPNRARGKNDAARPATVRPRRAVSFASRSVNPVRVPGLRRSAQVGEPELDLACGRLRRVRAVHDVVLHRQGEVAPDAAGVGLDRVGRARQLPERLDRAVALHHRGHHRAGGDERQQLAEERLVL